MENLQGIIEKVKSEIEKGHSAEEIFRSLESLLGKDATVDQQLAESLALLRDEKSAEILRRMFQISKEKRVLRAIKRSLYRLKSKGIRVEELSAEREGSILRPPLVEPPKGMGGSIDFLGQRFLILIIPHRGRGETVMEGVTSDTLGLLSFSGGEMTKKGVRIFLEEIEKGSPLPLVETEASYVASLFIQAHQLTLVRKRPVPQDYLSLRGEIESIKRDYERPLVYSLLLEDEVTGEDRWLRRGGDLLKADLFLDWRIEEDLIRPYADEVREAQESKILLHPTQKEARFQAIYEKALSELFSGERRFLYKRRLEEMAYVLLKLDREEEARTSLAVAIDLEKPLNQFQPNPFLYQLVVKSIFALLAKTEEKKKEPSLIVKP